MVVMCNRTIATSYEAGDTEVCDQVGEGGESRGEMVRGIHESRTQRRYNDSSFVPWISRAEQR